MNLDALKSTHYRQFWLGSIVTTGSIQLYLFAMPWLVFELSGSATHLGLLGFCLSVPTIAVTLIGGIVADSINRGHILLITSLLAGSILGFLSFFDFLDAISVFHVFIIAAILGLISGFDIPARVSFFSSLISPNQMMSAVALNSIVWQVSRMTLPAVAGVLISFAGTSLIFLICSIGFILMSIILSRLRSIAPTKKNIGNEISLSEAYTFIKREKLFAVLIGMSWIFIFFGASYVQIMPIIAGALGMAEKGYGILISSTGFGSVIGTIIISRYQLSPKLGLIMMGGMLTSTISIFCFSIITAHIGNNPWAFYCLCIFALTGAIGGSFFWLSSMSIMQTAVPDRLRGRVMGIHSITFSLIALGGLFMGIITDIFSASIAIGSGAITVFASIVYFSFAYPRLWRLNEKVNQIYI